MAIHVVGDFVDLHSFVLKTMDHSVGALTRCRVALVPHEFLQGVTERLPHLTRLLWLDTLVDAATHREWIVGMGRRSALEQLAHLICELYVRLEVLGQVDGATFDLPLTQTDLGDALGLSLVHINRTVRELREAGLLIVAGLVLAAPITEQSNWRATGGFNDWLVRNNLIGLSGVDTRRLTRRLRDLGAANAAIGHAPDDACAGLSPAVIAFSENSTTISLMLRKRNSCRTESSAPLCRSCSASVSAGIITPSYNCDSVCSAR